MSDKKVLIITYYWPPSGGSGVQRWLKFVKYLPSFGWEPYVFTPENPAFDLRDESLLNDVPAEAEVIRFPIWEPYEAFFKISSLFGGSKKKGSPAALLSGKKKSIFQQVSTWVRGNFFIPDPRVFWVWPSVKFLEDFIRDQKIRTVITTGPPHSIHLIGMRLKKKNPSINWIADFRDPWSEWVLLDSLQAASIARSIHKRLERNVLQRADKVVTITPFYVRHFEKLGGRKVQLLTNGYDETDFASLTIIPQPKFVIRHVGIVHEMCNPRPFMQVVEQLMQADENFGKDLHLDFTGEVHPDFKQFVVQSSSLNAVTTFTPSVPHKQLMQVYGTSSVLLIVLVGYKDAEGYMPGKLFEYLATGLPVLGVGPGNGDAAQLLKESNAGVMLEPDKPEAIRNQLLNLYQQWKKGSKQTTLQPATQYSRRGITEKLTELLK